MTTQKPRACLRCGSYVVGFPATCPHCRMSYDGRHRLGSRERPYGEDAQDPPPPPAPRTYRDGGGSDRRLLVVCFFSIIGISAVVFGIAFFFDTPKPAAPKAHGGHTHDVLPSGELGPARCE